MEGHNLALNIEGNGVPLSLIFLLDAIRGFS